MDQPTPHHMHDQPAADDNMAQPAHIALHVDDSATHTASASAAAPTPTDHPHHANMRQHADDQSSLSAPLVAHSLDGSLDDHSIGVPAVGVVAAVVDGDLSVSDASDSDAERHEAAMQLRRRAILTQQHADGEGDQLDGGDGGTGAGTDGVAVAGGMASSASACASAADASRPLPASLRLATLRLTPLHAHLLLFPSHKFDANYQNSMVPAAERRTSYETSDIASFPCPVLMNTPDSTLNWPYGLVEPDMTPFDAAAAKASTQQQQPFVSPSSSPAQSSSPPVIGSPPPAFLLKSSSPTAAADDGPMRDGFVQCAKCSKWRTVPDTEDVQSLPSPWTCDLNTWDPRNARCASMDEVFEEGELWAGMPKRFTRLVDHDAFYRRLVALLHQQHNEAVSAGSPLPAHIDNDSGELEKFPHIRRRPVDLFRTYTSVIQLGGYDKVSASNQWKIIQSCLHIPDQHDSSLTLKRLYKRFLYEYERTYWKNPRPQPASAAAGTSTPAAPAPAAASSSRSTRPSKQQSFSSSNTHSASVSSSAGAAAAAASSSAADTRKRRQKLMRSGSESANGGGGGGGGDESDEEMDAVARKRQRRLADLVDADEYGDGTAMLDEEVSGDEEKAERLFDLQGRPLPSSVPRPTGNASPFAHMSAAVPVPTINAIGISVRNLRNAMESKFRTLEKRMDERFNKLENTITKAIRDATQQVRDQATSVAHKEKARVHRLHKDQQRKSDLLAKGLNMIIAERLKAALPRLAHAKIKQHMKEEREKLNQLAMQQQQQLEAAAAAAAAAAATGAAAAVFPASAKAAAPPTTAAALFPLLPSSAAAAAAAAISSGAAGPVLLTPFQFMMHQQQLNSPTLNAAAVAAAAAAASSAADVPASASNSALKTPQMTVKSETSAPAAAAAAAAPTPTGPSPMQVDTPGAAAPLIPAATPATDPDVASSSQQLSVPPLTVSPAAAASTTLHAPVPPVAVLPSPPAPAMVDILGVVPMPTSSPPLASDSGAGHVMSIPFLGRPSVPGGNGDVDKFLQADVADAE